MNNILSIDSVSKHYGNFTALNNVSVNIREGSIFGLLGPNGAGKTTLIRVINQITYPDSGKVLFNNSPLELKHIRDIGYLPEERGLYPKMKIGEQAVYLAQLKGLDSSTAKSELNKWFEKFQINDWWDKKVTELSKGMAQKIQFITTVLHEPKLLIFDEPFSGLDPVNAALIRDEILRIRDDGATIVLSTHRMESVEELCSHIALLNNGEKILDGSVNDIKESHRDGNFRLIYRSDKAISLSIPNEVHLVQNNADIKKGVFIAELQSQKQSASQIIKSLSSQVDTISFEEIIPSMNDIFIKSVKK